MVYVLGHGPFFIMPTKGDWKVMFNTVNDGWGTGKYDATNDALTLTVKPAESVMENIPPLKENPTTKWKNTLNSKDVKEIASKALLHNK